jgi:cellulose synthase operon protein YhjQ
MAERPSDPEQSAIPEDIATLYSRAQMQGTRYWDFSASRKEVRGEFRQRTLREKGEQARSGPVRAPEPAPPMREVTDSRVAEAQTLAGPRMAAQPLPREGVAPRWQALHSVLAPAEVVEEPPVAPMDIRSRPPTVAVFSLAGGVGKTCLVATLGRALSALGEQVLLADTATCGLLPFYFGSREFKPGVVRTFSASGAESGAPVRLLNLDAERYPGDAGEQDPLLGELVRDGRGASRILIDVATASREVTRRLLLLCPTVLVPVLPDMSSVACLGSLDAFLANVGETFYLLNQFDAASPLHLEVRAMLQQRLGDRLLPVVMRRSPAVSEAMAEGMTVIDYAPGSPAAEDYWNLAGWLRSFAAPAEVGYGGVRWSER